MLAMQSTFFAMRSVLLISGTQLDENTKTCILALIGIISTLGGAWIGYLIAKMKK